MKDITQIGKWTNSKCVVLGCGKTARRFDSPWVFAIGVNDIGMIHVPDMLVLVDTRKKFGLGNPGRPERIESAPSKYNVVCDASWNFEDKCRLDLGALRSFANLDHPTKVDYYLDSPYVCAILAYKLGFRNIGLLGVDFEDGHFYADDGPHQLMRLGRVQGIREQYGKLVAELKRRGCGLFNLGGAGLGDYVPRMTYNRFVARRPAR